MVEGPCVTQGSGPSVQAGTGACEHTASRRGDGKPLLFLQEQGVAFFPDVVQSQAPLAKLLYSSSNLNCLGLLEKRTKESNDSIFLAMVAGNGSTWLMCQSLDRVKVQVTLAI